MAVMETGVSYYGLNYVEHARRDFQEMLDHHCTAVVLALSEFDLDFWFPNIRAIAQAGRAMGLKVYLDTWGIGKWFGGEPPSLFLTNNPGNRQVSAFTGEPLPACCFNTKAFRDYFFDICEASSGTSLTMPCRNHTPRSPAARARTGPAAARSACGAFRNITAMRCRA